MTAAWYALKTTPDGLPSLYVYDPARRDVAGDRVFSDVAAANLTWHLEKLATLPCPGPEASLSRPCHGAGEKPILIEMKLTTLPCRRPQATLPQPLRTAWQSSRVLGTFGRRNRRKGESLPAYHKCVSHELNSDDETMMGMRDADHAAPHPAALSNSGRVWSNMHAHH